MKAPYFPAPGTKLRRFLDAMLTGTTSVFPEFLQAPGHSKLLAMAEDLRAMGWPVQVMNKPAPVLQQPGRHVAVFFIDRDDIADMIWEDC